MSYSCSPRAMLGTRKGASFQKTSKKLLFVEFAMLFGLDI